MASSSTSAAPRPPTRSRGRQFCGILIDATGAEVVTTVLNGDYLQVPVTKERELVDTLSRHGIRAIRDDAVIHALAGSQDV